MAVMVRGQGRRGGGATGWRGGGPDHCSMMPWILASSYRLTRFRLVNSLRDLGRFAAAGAAGDDGDIVLGYPV